MVVRRRYLPDRTHTKAKLISHLRLHGAHFDVFTHDVPR